MAREGKVIVKILKDICQELPFFGHSHQRSKVTIVKPCNNNLKKLECNLTFQQNAITQDNRANFVLNADGTKGVESGTPIKYIVKRFDDDVLAKEEVVLQDNFGWAFQEVLWQDKIPRGKRVKYVFRLEVGKEFCEKELEYNKPATAICGENSLTKEEETNEYIKFRYKTYVSNFEDNLVRHLYKSIDGVNWSECPFTEENVHIIDGSHIELLYTVQKSSLQGETHFKASVDVMTKGQLELTCETGTIELNPSVPDIKCSLNVSTSKQQQPSGALYYVNISHGETTIFPAHSFKMYLETIVDNVSKGKELIYENDTTGVVQDFIRKDVFIDNNNFKVVIFKVTIELTNGTICEHNERVFNFICGDATFRKEEGAIGINLIATVSSNLDSENPTKEYFLYGKINGGNWENIIIQPTEIGNELIFANVPEKDTYKLTVKYNFRINDNGDTTSETCSYDWENQKQPPVCNNISITQKSPQGAGSYKMDITANVTLNDYVEDFKLKIFTRSKNSVDFTLKSELDKSIGTTITETDFYDSSLSSEGYYIKAELWNYDNTINYCNTDEQLVPKDVENTKPDSIDFKMRWFGLPEDKLSYKNNYLRYITLKLDYISDITNLKDKLGTINSIKYVKENNDILYEADSSTISNFNNALQDKTDKQYTNVLVIDKTKLSNITESESVKVKAVIESSTGTYESNYIEKVNILGAIPISYILSVNWEKTNNELLEYEQSSNQKTYKVRAGLTVTNSSNLDIGKVIFIPSRFENNLINSSNLNLLPESFTFDIDSSQRTFRKIVTFDVTIPDDKFNGNGIDDLFGRIYLEELKENFDWFYTKEGYLTGSPRIKAIPKREKFTYRFDNIWFTVNNVKTLYNKDSLTSFNYKFNVNPTSNNENKDIVKNVTVKLMNLFEDGTVTEVAKKEFEGLSSKGFRLNDNSITTISFDNINIPLGNNRTFLTISGNQVKEDGSYDNNIETEVIRNVIIDTKVPKIGWLYSLDRKRFDKRKTVKSWVSLNGVYSPSAGKINTSLSFGPFYDDDILNTFDTYTIGHSSNGTPLNKLADSGIGNFFRIPDKYYVYVDNEKMSGYGYEEAYEKLKTGTHGIKYKYYYDNLSINFGVEELIESPNTLEHEMIEEDKKIEISYDDDSVIYETYCANGIKDTPIFRSSGLYQFRKLDCNNHDKNIVIKGLNDFIGNEIILSGIPNTADMKELNDARLNDNQIFNKTDGVIYNVKDFSFSFNNYYFQAEPLGSRLVYKLGIYAHIYLEDYNNIYITNGIEFNIYKDK